MTTIDVMAREMSPELGRIEQLTRLAVRYCLDALATTPDAERAFVLATPVGPTFADGWQVRVVRDGSALRAALRMPYVPTALADDEELDAQLDDPASPGFTRVILVGHGSAMMGEFETRPAEARVSAPGGSA